MPYNVYYNGEQAQNGECCGGMKRIGDYDGDWLLEFVKGYRYDFEVVALAAHYEEIMEYLELLTCRGEKTPSLIINSIISTMEKLKKGN